MRIFDQKGSGQKSASFSFLLHKVQQDLTDDFAPSQLDGAEIAAADQVIDHTFVYMAQLFRFRHRVQNIPHSMVSLVSSLFRWRCSEYPLFKDPLSTLGAGTRSEISTFLSTSLLAMNEKSRREITFSPASKKAYPSGLN